MSIQEKHVSVNLAAHQSAKFLGGVAELSQTATVVLFRVLVLNERVSPSTDVGKELIKAGFVQTFGQLLPWVANHMAECIKDLLASSGCNLLPQDAPTSIKDLGHVAIKGRSKTTRKTRRAQKLMEATAFCVDRKVLALGITALDLSPQDNMVAAVLGNESMVPDKFYFPISYDYRGRMYYRGGIITPQGSDFLKGVLQFADKAPIGKTGRFAIVMALADAAGFKGTKREAMAWSKTVDLVSIATRQGCKAGKGFQAAGLACELIALNHWCESNFEELFESGIICHQDATCSGLQIAAAATGCRRTAIATNCVASDSDDGKSDLYGDVAVDWAKTPTLLGRYAETHGRDMAKKAVMLIGYGAGKELLKLEISQWLLEEQGITMTWSEAEESALMTVLIDHCAAALEVKRIMQGIAGLHDDAFSWTTHDDFLIEHDKQEGDEVRLGKFAMKFDVAYNQDANITAAAPNFVHSIDAAQIREAICLSNLNDAGHCYDMIVPVAAIHDSIGTRPCDYVAMGKSVRQAFALVDVRGILQRLATDNGLVLASMGDYDPREALQSSYFWC